MRILEKVEGHLRGSGTRFMSGDSLTRADCYILPSMQHIRVAGKVCHSGLSDHFRTVNYTVFYKICILAIIFQMWIDLNENYISVFGRKFAFRGMVCNCIFYKYSLYSVI